MRHIDLHRSFQKLLSWLTSELEHVDEANDILVAAQWAFFTEKAPLVLQAQIYLSSGRWELIGIAFIDFASCGKNRGSTASTFQEASSLFNDSLTFISSGINNLGDETMNVEGLGSYLSPQIQIFSPFPTFHRKPYLTRGWAEIILRQVNGGLLPKTACEKSLVGKYLAFKTLYTKVHDLVEVSTLALPIKPY